MRVYMLWKRQWHVFVGTVVSALYASSASAQQIPDMFGQTARTLDQIRLQQGAGILAMVVFSLCAAWAAVTKKLSAAVTCVCLAFASYLWYSDVGRTMITTTGTPIAP